MEHPTVLLIEGEPVIAADLSALLQSLHCQVLWAANGREAFALCALRVPDFVVLNFCRSDGTDGMALARALRETFPIKVFFVTGARRQDLEASPHFEAGHAVLYKPFTWPQFKTAMRYNFGV